MAIHSPEAFVGALLFFVLAVWVKRVVWIARFRRSQAPLKPASPPSPAPLVSIIVPARNEEKNLDRCLSSLLAQDYPSLELVVVDDRSNDTTGSIAESFRLRSRFPVNVIRVEKLPPGWTGKNYAMFTGSKAAGGEWLLFTDADTYHRVPCVSTAVRTALDNRIDFLTLAPETESRSFWEKTVQPLAVSSLALWFDPVKVNDPKSGVTLANGQFILVKKEVYEKTGGNESVRQDVVEDVAFAKRTRAHGYSVQFLNGTLLYATRMYSSLREIKNGWTRIFTHLFEKKPAAILHKIFLFLLFSIFPFAVLAIEKCFYLWKRESFDAGLFLWSGVVCAFIVAVRFVGNRLVKTSPWYAFLHPLGSLVMVWILSICLWRIALGRPSLWRGDAHR